MAGRQASSKPVKPKAEEYLVKAESNLEEYPFFAIKRRNRKLEPRVFERTLESENEASLHQQWTVMPSAGYGTPGPLDQDVYLAVLELLERKGGMPANGKLHFSLYELVEILGWSKSGKNGGKVYRDVRDSKERDSYISDSFNIWSVHLVSDRPREGEPRERHSLEFHRIFIRNFQTQYLKGVDADFYWSLHSPLARRLYRMIDQQRCGQLTFQENLFTLREQIPLADYPYASKIKEVLSRAHEELIERGFISEVGYEGETIRYRVSGEFVSRQKALELSGDPEEVFAIRRLMTEGVRGDIARDLVARYGSEKCLRYAEALATQKGIRNRGGWLRKAIEEGYDLPETLPLQHLTREAGRPSAAIERDQRTQAPAQTPKSAPKSSFDQGRLSSALEHSEDPDPASTPSAESHVADTEAEGTWEALVADLVTLHGRDSLPPWFEQFQGGQLEGSTLTVVVPNSYAANHLNENFGEDLLRLWHERSGEEEAVLQVTTDLSAGVRARLCVDA
jgi:hypothetical protein